MAKNSAVNLDITNNSDGFDIGGGTTKRTFTISGGNISLVGSATASIGVSVTSPTYDLEIGTNSATSATRGIAINQYNTGTDAGRFTFRKARGTGTTTVANGDNLADILMQGYATSMTTRARIQARVSDVVSGNITPTQLALATENPTGTLVDKIIIESGNAVTFGGTSGNGSCDLYVNKIKKSNATQTTGSWTHEIGISNTGADMSFSSPVGFAFYLDIDNNTTTQTFDIVQGNGGFEQGVSRWNINENGSLNHTSIATSVATQTITANSQTTGNVMTITANALTTGSGIALSSSSANTSARTLFTLSNSSSAATGAKCFAITQSSTATPATITHNATGTALDIQASSNSANKAYGILMNIANAGAGLEYAFRFDGSEIVAAAVGGTQDKKIRVSIAGVDYFIPLYTA